MATALANADEMISQNLELVGHRVIRFLRRCTYLEHLKDDLQSAGQLALVQAVNRIISGGSGADHVPQYLRTCIDAALKDEAARYSDRIGTPRSQFRRKKRGDVQPKYVEYKNEHPDPHADAPPAFETMEEVLACCQTDQERQAITLLAEGYSRKEVAEQLNVSEPRVSQIRTRVRKAYRDRSEPE